MCLNLVALTSWKKHICSLNLHQDVRPITQILASYCFMSHFKLSPKKYIKKIKSGQRNLWRDWQLIRRPIQINQFFCFSHSGCVPKVCSLMNPFSCYVHAWMKAKGPMADACPGSVIFLGSAHRLHPQSHSRPCWSFAESHECLFIHKLTLHAWSCIFICTYLWYDMNA